MLPAIPSISLAGLLILLLKKRRVPLGYVETKDMGGLLDKVEKSDQMKRYLKALHNLILTDYIEFRWYENGVRKVKASIAEVGKNKKLTRNPQGIEAVEQMFQGFFLTEAPSVENAKELASRLANVTHFIRDQIIAALGVGRRI